MAREEKEKKTQKEKSAHGRAQLQKKEKVKAPTKIVIRHLPPTMTEEEFLTQIDPLPEHESYYFVSADWSLGFDATCRAYITLKTYNDVFLFRDRFDGYVFVDSKGAEYSAIVEFAPFQGMAKNKSRRSDNKVNTIEKESHYQEFLAKLEEDREAATKGGESKLEFSLDRKKDEKITSTPLLQYLALKKEKRREEAKKRVEEKRRQRDEEKERRDKPQQQQVTRILPGGRDAREGRDGGGKKSTAALSGKEKGAGGNRSEQRGEQRRAKRQAERDQKRREKQQRKKEAQLDKQANVEGGAGGGGGGAGAGGAGGAAGGGRAKGKPSEAPVAAAARKEAAEKPNMSDVNDTVVQFILSVTTVNEFVPQVWEAMPQDEDAVAKSQEPSQGAAAAQADDDDKRKSLPKSDATRLSSVKDKVEKNPSAKELKIRNSGGEQKRQSAGASSSTAAEDRRTQRQRAAEERRIRNKDRPSLAIYQPKARLMVGESEGPAGKEACSNPPSDCESVQKEELRTKKVARYSERRSERRAANRDKQKSTTDDVVEPSSKASHQPSNRKSSESSGGEHSKPEPERAEEREQPAQQPDTAAN